MTLVTKRQLSSKVDAKQEAMHGSLLAPGTSRRAEQVGTSAWAMSLSAHRSWPVCRSAQPESNPRLVFGISVFVFAFEFVAGVPDRAVHLLQASQQIADHMIECCKNAKLQMCVSETIPSQRQPQSQLQSQNQQSSTWFSSGWVSSIKKPRVGRGTASDVWSPGHRKLRCCAACASTS